MNSESIEIRIRSIYILILSFSTPTGKLDPKQVYAFDKMHGFQSMAEQLTNFIDGCTTEILDAICSLLFWKQHSSSSKVDNSPLIYRMGIESAAALLSTLSVAPAISIVDKAIVSNASGLILYDR
jgi:hypothetical protein